MEVLSVQPADYEKYMLTFHKPGLGSDACVKAYDKTGGPQAYADSSASLEYRGPRYCADMLAAVVDNKEKALVLDIAAGTGLVGEELYKHGFRNVHAHDGSSSMVDFCRNTGVYSDFISCFLSDQSPMPFKDNTYDAVACSGATCENHLPPAIQAEFIRILKPGGYFVNAFRSTVPSTQYGKDWEAETKRLEDQQKWTFYGRLHFRKYNMFSDGVVDIYRKNSNPSKRG